VQFPPYLPFALEVAFGFALSLSFFSFSLIAFKTFSGF